MEGHVTKAPYSDDLAFRMNASSTKVLQEVLTGLLIHGTEREIEWDQRKKKMPQNEEGSKMELICVWVP